MSKATIKTVRVRETGVTTKVGEEVGEKDSKITREIPYLNGVFSTEITVKMRVNSNVVLPIRVVYF